MLLAVREVKWGEAGVGRACAHATPGPSNRATASETPPTRVAVEIGIEFLLWSILPQMLAPTPALGQYVRPRMRGMAPPRTQEGRYARDICDGIAADLGGVPNAAIAASAGRSTGCSSPSDDRNWIERHPGCYLPHLRLRSPSRLRPVGSVIIGWRSSRPVSGPTPG